MKASVALLVPTVIVLTLEDLIVLEAGFYTPTASQRT